MDSKKYFINSVKGLLINSVLENKAALITAIWITLGTALVNNIVYISMLLFSNINSTNDNEGALSVGFSAALIVLVISTFISVSDKQIGKKFVFPINRDVYAISSFLSIIIMSVLVLAGISIISLLELIIGNFIEFMNPQFVLTNQITLFNYGIGLWLSFCYLVFAISFAYLAAMYFHRYRLKTVLVIGLLIFSIFPYGFVRNILFDIVKFIFFEQSIGILSLKLGVLTLLFHMLAYIPLKRMEVLR